MENPKKTRSAQSCIAAPTRAAAHAMSNAPREGDESAEETGKSRSSQNASGNSAQRRPGAKGPGKRAQRAGSQGARQQRTYGA